MNKKGIISSLFFLEFFVLGTYQPLMSLYCRDYLAFSGLETGLILSTATVAAFISPAMTMILADRIISAEKLLGILQLLSGVFLVLISGVRHLMPLFLVYLLMNIFITPTNALLNSITFKNLGSKQGNRFGSIRVWGTLGWIGAAVFFTFFWMNPKVPIPFERDLGTVFPVAAAVSFCCGIIVFSGLRNYGTDKKVNAEYTHTGSSIPKDKVLWGFFLLCFLISVQDKYYFLGISPFLKDVGVMESNILFIISIGQMSEVLFMLLLSRLLGTFGIKRIMAAGAAASCLRYMIFLICSLNTFVPVTAIVCGIFFHGLIFALYMAVAIIYLDSFCTAENRAALHQFYYIVTSGAGSLVGNIFGGILLDISLSVFSNYFIFWLCPGLLSLAVLLLVPKFITRS